MSKKMSSDEDEINVDDLVSLNLVANFKRKASAANFSKLEIDDSLMPPSQMQESYAFIRRIYFTGTCPWEDKNTSPHLFFTIPFDPTLFDPVSTFCFPHGGHVAIHDIKSVSDFINEALSRPNDDELEFFTLYFPTIEDSPYFYCCRFMGSPFSMPTISHDLTLDDIFSLVSKKSVPCSEMCICVQSSYPDKELYYNFIKWLLQCERIGKFSITEAADKFIEGNISESELERINEIWPEKHRQELSALTAKVVFNQLPEPGERINVDNPPFPPFLWERENFLNRKEAKLDVSCMKTLLSFTNLTVYMQILSLLLLEKRIVVYSKSIEIATDVILAFHAMLKPLKWVAPTISILPDSCLDIFDSPSPTLIAIDVPIKNLPSSSIYFNCDTCELKYRSKQLLTIPYNKKIEERLAPFFEKIEGKEKDVLEMTNMAIKDILTPLRASIITDFSDPKKSGSRFLPELFLKSFPGESRAFVKTMIGTQMMQYHIEIVCKQCSAESDNQAKHYKYSSENE